MIQPNPFKLKCTKCNYSIIVHPKSDALNPSNYAKLCPKCQSVMKIEALDKKDKMVDFILRWF